jgi:Zn finger protein HypA/HybF involved in hydrogenase expression
MADKIGKELEAKEEERKSKATVAYCPDCRIVRSSNQFHFDAESVKSLSHCNECGVKLTIYPEYPKCKCGNRIDILEDRYCPYCGIKIKTYLGGTKAKIAEKQEEFFL